MPKTAKESAQEALAAAIGVLTTEGVTPDDIRDEVSKALYQAREEFVIEEVKKRLSANLRQMQSTGFRCLEPVLREALFGSTHKLDWTAIVKEFEKQCPEVNLPY